MKHRDIAAPDVRGTGRAGLYGQVWTAKSCAAPGRGFCEAMHDVNDVAQAGAADEGGSVLNTTHFLRALGIAVRERREELELTQEAVSLRTGVPQRRIWEIEAGAGNPTARTLLRLVSGLDVPASKLVAR